MNVVVKCIINIFTIIDGNVNLLLKANGDLLEVDCLDNMELTCSNYINNNISIKNLDLNQVYTFSNKSKDLNLTTIYCDIINIDDIKINDKFKFVEIDNLDKSNEYIKLSIEYLKKNIVLLSEIKKVYSKEFVLPELQRIYEKILDKKYDRRNFRKKLIKLDIIQSLDKVSLTKGRPAKLYIFKDLKEDISLL